MFQPLDPHAVELRTGGCGGLAAATADVATAAAGLGHGRGVVAPHGGKKGADTLGGPGEQDGHGGVGGAGEPLEARDGPRTEGDAVVSGHGGVLGGGMVSCQRLGQGDVAPASALRHPLAAGPGRGRVSGGETTKGVFEGHPARRVQVNSGEVELEKTGGAILHGRGAGDVGGRASPEVEAEELYDSSERAVFRDGIVAGSDEAVSETELLEPAPSFTDDEVRTRAAEGVPTGAAEVWFVSLCVGNPGKDLVSEDILAELREVGLCGGADIRGKKYCRVMSDARHEIGITFPWGAGEARSSPQTYVLQLSGSRHRRGTGWAVRGVAERSPFQMKMVP